MNRILYIILSLSLILIFRGSVYPQAKLFGIGGNIRDRESNTSLPYAHVRIMGTSQGTVANEKGYYFVVLEQGSHMLLFSYIGYNTDTLTVEIKDENLIEDIYLAPSATMQSEIVVSAFMHNPAERIILRAIERKHEILEKLRNYNFNAYSKSVFNVDVTKKGKRDTLIVGILETQSSGFWAKPDKYKEIITSRKQTANFNPAQNVFSLGVIPNLNDDVINFGRNLVVGPVNPRSLDFYSFEMQDTTAINGINVYRIRMEPRKNNIPLFKGVISIADSTYSVMDIDVTFNEVFQLPPLRDFRLREKFALYDEFFWLPVHVNYEFDMTFMNFMPRINNIMFKQTSIIHDYSINDPDFNNDIFDYMIVNVSPGADETDSLTWASRQAIPLTQKEKQTYEEVEKDMKRPFGRVVKFLFHSPLNIEDLPITEFSDFYRFNRVEGNYLGVGLKFDYILPQTSLTLTGGYGFADENFKYKIEAEQFFTPEREVSIGFRASKHLNTTYPEFIFGTTTNTFLALFEKEDYYDYYLSKGWKIFGRWRPLPRTLLEVSYKNESQTSQSRNSDYSLFGSGNYRENPLIDDGDLKGLELSFNYDSRKFMNVGVTEMPVNGKNGWIINTDIKYSSPGFNSSHFDFSRFFASVRRDQFTRGIGYFVFKMAVGLTGGDIPRQYLFSLPGSISDYSSFGTFKTIDINEFSGDMMAAFHFEYNLGSYLFRTLKVPYFKKRHYELIFFTAAGWTDMSYYSTHAIAYPVNITDETFWEAGFGLGGILFFRFDFTWRLTHKYENKFVIRLGSSLY
ncbi:MAG: carboxypeptidase-like regulatory domain-containing protein [bacterium]|nr:carboxypeptidase-like regulatory domain-containing protein [bacterium]